MYNQAMYDALNNFGGMIAAQLKAEGVFRLTSENHFLQIVNDLSMKIAIEAKLEEGVVAAENKLLEGGYEH